MSNRKKVVSALAQHGLLTAQDIADKSGLDLTRVKQTITDCSTQKWTETRGRCDVSRAPLYRVTDKGKAWLAEQGVEIEPAQANPNKLPVEPVQASIASPAVAVVDSALFLRDLATLFDLPDRPANLTKAFLVIKGLRQEMDEMIAATAAEKDARIAELEAQVAALTTAASTHCDVVAKVLLTSTPTSLSQCSTVVAEAFGQLQEKMRDYNSTGDILGHLVSDFDSDRPLWELAAQVGHMLEVKSKADAQPHPLQLVFDKCVAHAIEASPKAFCDQYWVDLAEQFGVGLLYGEAAQLLMKSQRAAPEERMLDMIEVINHVAKGVLFEKAGQESAS